MAQDQLREFISKKTGRRCDRPWLCRFAAVVEFARNGFQAFGFEVDASKAERINAGESYIGDLASGMVKELVDSKHLRATTDFNHLAECDASIICVPTPLRKTKEPDISWPRNRSSSACVTDS